MAVTGTLFVLLVIASAAHAAEPCKGECSNSDDEVAMLQNVQKDQPALEPERAKSCMTVQTPEDTSKKASAAAALAATAELTKLTAIANDIYSKAFAAAGATHTHMKAKNTADKTAKLAGAQAHYTEAVDRADAEAKKQLMHDMEQVNAKKKRDEALAIQNTKWSMDKITREHARKFKIAADTADQTEKVAQQTARDKNAITVNTELSKVMGLYTVATKKHQASMKSIVKTAELEKMMATDRVETARVAEVAKAETERAKLAKAADEEWRAQDADALIQKNNQEANALSHKNAMKEEAKNEMNVASMGAWVETMSEEMSDVTLCSAPAASANSYSQNVVIAGR